MVPNEELMGTPSNCLYKVLSKIKNDSFVASCRSFSKLAQSRFEAHCALSNDSLEQIFAVSSRGMLVNKEVISRLAIKQSEFCCSIYLAKSNESLTLYPLEVKSLSIETMAEKIGRKSGQLSITFLGTFITP